MVFICQFTPLQFLSLDPYSYLIFGSLAFQCCLSKSSASYQICGTLSFQQLHRAHNVVWSNLLVYLFFFEIRHVFLGIYDSTNSLKLGRTRQSKIYLYDLIVLMFIQSYLQHLTHVKPEVSAQIKQFFQNCCCQVQSKQFFSMVLHPRLVLQILSELKYRFLASL